MVWASIFAILFLNGSVFGVFNYWAAYLANVVGLAPNLVSLLLFGYGLCNIFGSMAAGHLLSSRAEDTVKFFPSCWEPCISCSLREGTAD